MMKVLELLKNGFIKGVGIAAGLCATGLFAATVTWTFEAFTPNQTITAEAFNLRFDAIRAAIAAIDPQYSTSETATHLRWTDGKTIYRKVVNFGSLPNNTEKNVPHNISGLATVTRLYGIMSNGTNQYQLPHADPTGANNDTPLWADSASIRMATSNAFFTSYSAVVVIEYTRN